MNRLFSLVTFSAAAAASVVQHPLNDGPSSQALIKTKPLVSSKALEGHITSKNLLKRAEKLFEIAELGAKDYNHPTRVIGSAGKHGCGPSLSWALANESVYRARWHP